MGKIKKILEKELGSTQSVEVYPVTSIEAVYDENNERLDNIINRKNKEIQKELEAEVTRASNAESNLRETINNITEVNGNATSANIVTIDNIPNTSASNVQQALNELFENDTFAGSGVYDISAEHNNTAYADLIDALGVDGVNVPESIRKGGMSVRFLQDIPANYSVVKTEGLKEQPTGTELEKVPSIDSDIYSADELSDFPNLPTTLNVNAIYYVAITTTENVGEKEVTTTTYTKWVITNIHIASSKYAQWMLTSSSWSTDINNWHGIEDGPTRGSQNLVTSGAVFDVAESVSDLTTYREAGFRDISSLFVDPYKTTENLEYGGYNALARAGKIDVIDYRGYTMFGRGFGFYGFILQDGSVLSYGTTDKKYTFSLVVPDNAVTFVAQGQQHSNGGEAYMVIVMPDKIGIAQQAFDNSIGNKLKLQQLFGIEDFSIDLNDSSRRIPKSITDENLNIKYDDYCYTNTVNVTKYRGLVIYAGVNKGYYGFKHTDGRIESYSGENSNGYGFYVRFVIPETAEYFVLSAKEASAFANACIISSKNIKKLEDLSVINPSYYLKGMKLKGDNASKVPCILLAGQSNAKGSTRGDKPEYITGLPFENCKFTANQTQDNNGFINSPSIPFNSFNYPSQQGSVWGFDIILYYYLSQISNNFYVIKSTMFDTSIDEAGHGNSTNYAHWTADYEGMASRSFPLLRYFEKSIISHMETIKDSSEIRVLIWNQGEGDKYDGANVHYYANLRNFIAYVRGVVHNPSLPVILYTISTVSNDYDAVVEQAQRKLAAEDPNIYLIDVEDAPMQEDNVHYSTSTAEYIGKLTYDKLIDLGIFSGEKLNPEKPY